MGTWSTGLFSDDTACDVRGEYRDLVGDGHSGPEATKILLREYKGELNDPDTGPIIWLALAVTQWKCGRLEERVGQRALRIIDKGLDLRRWEDDPKLLKKRSAVLAELRNMLVSPQPPEKRIPKRYRDTCEWTVGEIISYRLRSGKLVLLRVIGHHTDKGGTCPICELLDWVGKSIPPEKEMKRLKVKKDNWEVHQTTQFMIGRMKEKELPADRVTRLGIKLKPAQKPGACCVFFWQDLDQHLQRDFDVK